MAHTRMFIALLVAASATLVFASSAIAGPPPLPKIISASETACAIDDASALRCWGENNRGQLGDGTLVPRHTPAFVAGFESGAVDVALAAETTCAVRSDGKVICFGSNAHAGLGQGVADGDPHPTATVVPGIDNAVAIAGTFANFCAELATGTAKCWGNNLYGQAGNGLAAYPNVIGPTDVINVSGVKKLVGGYFSFCALLNDGAVWCWGMNESGQLGRLPFGPLEKSSTPMPAAGISGAIDIIGGEGPCVLLGGGSVKCWGDNWFGQLGTGSYMPSNTAALVDTVGLDGAIALVGSHKTHCAVFPGFAIKCWGDNTYMQLRPGSGGSPTPIDMNLGPDVVGFTGGSDASNLCAIFKGGSVQCWGANYSGESGSPNLSSAMPDHVTVPGLDLLTVSYPATASSMTLVKQVTTDKKRKNYLLTGSASVTPSGLLIPAEACNGSAAITVTYNYKAKKTVRRNGKKKRIKVKRRKIWKAQPAFSAAGASCTASFAVKLPVKTLNRKTVVVEAVVNGSATMAAPAIAKQTVRLPKVKPLKKKKKKR